MRRGAQPQHGAAVRVLAHARITTVRIVSVHDLIDALKQIPGELEVTAIGDDGNLRVFSGEQRAHVATIELTPCDSNPAGAPFINWRVLLDMSVPAPATPRDSEFIR
jgi:hypothetical protein